MLVDFDERRPELSADSALHIRLARVEVDAHVRLVLVEDREGLETVVVDVLGLQDLKGLSVEQGVFAQPVDIGQIKLHLRALNILGSHEVENIRDLSSSQYVIEVIFIDSGLCPLYLQDLRRCLRYNHSID